MASPTTPERRRRRHRATITTALIWLGLLALPFVAVHNDHDRSVAEIRTAHASVAATTAARDQQAARIGELTTQVGLLVRTLDLLESGTQRTGAERTTAESTLTELVPAVALATDQLDQTAALADHQVLTSINLHDCSQGTTDALNLLIAGNRTGSLTRLRGVMDPCRYAQLALADGGDVKFPWDFADPSVIVDGGTYYAFATNAVGGHVQVIRSTDLSRWDWVGEGLPTLPAWAAPGQTWAPSAIRLGDRFALFFSARQSGSDVKCIGVAFSDKPSGPYIDSPPEPLVCQQDELGSIDPSPFINTDGAPYLVWKSEGDAKKEGPAKLWTAPLHNDGSGLSWFPTEVLASDRDDEDHTIEGPNMVYSNDQWILIYSSNRWASADYRMDYALCDSASGPCAKPANNTVLAKTDSAGGPGGGEIFRAKDGSLQLAYHAWLGADIGFPNNRYLHIDPLRVDAGNRLEVVR